MNDFKAENESDNIFSLERIKKSVIYHGNCGLDSRKDMPTLTAKLISCTK